MNLIFILTSAAIKKLSIILAHGKIISWTVNTNSAWESYLFYLMLKCEQYLYTILKYDLNICLSFNLPKWNYFYIQTHLNVCYLSTSHCFTCRSETSSGPLSIMRVLRVNVHIHLLDARISTYIKNVYIFYFQSSIN